MAADINKLFSGLTKSSEQILNVIDSLNAISKDAVAYNGDIARVVPQQLKVTIDSLLQVVQGQQQSSLESLTNFLDSIPISQLRKASLIKTTVNQEGVDQTNSSVNNSAAASAINTTPNTTGGAQSAIAEDTIDLRKYYNEQYGRKKDLKRVRENNELSFDAILDDQDMGIEYEDLVNGGDASRLDFAETPVNSYAEQFGLGMDEPLEDDMMFADDEGVETFDGDWHDMPSAHEADDFDTIMNDARNPVELGA